MYNDEVLATGDVYYEHHDQGMKRRCIDCLSQVAVVNGMRCYICNRKRDHRLGIRAIV